MPTSMLAQAIVLAGALLVAAGVFGLAGWPVAALVAGAETIFYGLCFVDLDAPSTRERGRR